MSQSAEMQSPVLCHVPLQRVQVTTYPFQDPRPTGALPLGRTLRQDKHNERTILVAVRHVLHVGRDLLRRRTSRPIAPVFAQGTEALRVLDIGRYRICQAVHRAGRTVPVQGATAGADLVRPAGGIAPSDSPWRLLVAGPTLERRADPLAASPPP